MQNTLRFLLSWQVSEHGSILRFALARCVVVKCQLVIDVLGSFPIEGAAEAPGPVATTEIAELAPAPERAVHPEVRLGFIVVFDNMSMFAFLFGEAFIGVLDMN